MAVLINACSLVDTVDVVAINTDKSEFKFHPKQFLLLILITLENTWISLFLPTCAWNNIGDLSHEPW